MKVLVTGIDGYIGAVLGPYLRYSGHEVYGLDTGYYRAGLLYDYHEDPVPSVRKDTRDVTEKDFAGFDAVVHLAELSNDPLGEHRTEVTFDINARGSMSVARAAKAAGVRRFVYFSSCSVYGIGGNDVKTEASAVGPKTAYAACKVACEDGLKDLLSPGFVTTCLRNATAFGASPRMRFDILLNNLAGLAWTTRRIAMTSDGTPWRPLVHVSDICQAADLVLQAPADAVYGEIFNVGDDAQNYRVREVAEIVGAAMPDCETSFGAHDPDNRSYRVSFGKIKKHLPDFSCRWSAQRGAEELIRLFRRIGMEKEAFLSEPFTRLKQLQRLIHDGQIDENFRWTAHNRRAARDEPAAQAAE